MAAPRSFKLRIRLIASAALIASFVLIGCSDEHELAVVNNVTTELLRRGYTEAEIAKLWGANFLRAFREVENVSQRLRVADSRKP
jgi:hypothetical protein